jgi:ribonuclease PH
LVEIQGTAEGEPFTEAAFLELMALARTGIGRLVELQRAAIAAKA